MKEKNIDRLFQEGLKDMEATPSPKVWNAIASKLDKKKRRVFPIWWFTSGVAAILILGLFLFPFTTKEKELIPFQEEIIITDTSNGSDERTRDVEEEKVVEKEEERKERGESRVGRGDKIEVIVKDKTELVYKKPRSDKSLTPQNKKTKNTNSPAFLAGKNQDVAVVTNQEVFKKAPEKQNTEIADRKTLEIGKEVPFDKKKKTAEESSVAFEESKEESTKNGLKDKKDFAKALKNKEEDTPENKHKKSWSVSPVFAVLSTNSFTENSPLDERLNTNKTKGNTTYSYGVKVAVQLNKKWAIQSGIHKQDFSFSTNNVAVSTVISSRERENNINYTSGSHFAFNESRNLLSATSFVAQDATIQQEYGYIEIPLEVKYTIIRNTKFNLNLVSGFSTLFLNKNTIEADSPDLTYALGEANNLNSTSFSGNFGFDLEYAFSKKWELNLAPIFKTQINTFSNNANGFQPYTIGLYSGIKYQF